MDCANEATTLSTRSAGQLARFVATEGRFRDLKANGKGLYDVLLEDLDALRLLIVEMQRLDAEDAPEPTERPEPPPGSRA